ncbi:TRAP transporter small permease [Rhodovulum sp. DZ06]|uniref:TRAP transporter small permease n=1 Tax=Rhodovulum sp. DZ06 TaxID=3425126 RepID=UPI003D331988
MTFLHRALGRAAALTSILAGLAVAAMMLHVTLDVAARHLFGAPLPGTLTLVSHYYMVIAAFVPLALAEHRGAHISVEVFTDRLPARARRHLAGAMTIPATAIMTLFTLRSWEAAMRAFDTGAAQVHGSGSIPTWPAYFALPLGGALTAGLLALRCAAWLTGADRDAPVPRADRADRSDRSDDTGDRA